MVNRGEMFEYMVSVNDTFDLGPYMGFYEVANGAFERKCPYYLKARMENCFALVLSIKNINKNGCK